MTTSAVKKKETGFSHCKISHVFVCWYPELGVKCFFPMKLSSTAVETLYSRLLKKTSHLWQVVPVKAGFEDRLGTSMTKPSQERKK